MALSESLALNILISRELVAPGAPAPTQFDPLTGRPLPGPAALTVTQAVPSRRYDAGVRDEVQGGDKGLYFGVDDSKYMVRFDSVNPWTTNDVFTDEAGNRRRVVGIRQVSQQAHISGGMIELIGRGT